MSPVWNAMPAIDISAMRCGNSETKGMCRTDIPMPAPARMYAHDNAVSATRPPTTIKRSRRNTLSVSDVFSAGISNHSMPDHTIVVEVQVSELPVAVLQI